MTPEDGAASTAPDVSIEAGLGVPSGPAKRKPLGRRIIGLVISVGLILFIFLGVIPQFADYSTAWDAIQKMSRGWWVALGIATVVNQMSFVWPYQAVLPHLRYRHGFMETQTTSAISNTVPAGGAVAIGMTFRMFGSYGFSPVAISTAVLTTGVWIMSFKLGLPIVAVVLVGVTGQNTGGVVGAAVLGVVVIVVLGLLLWLVFRSPTSALWIGRLGDRAVNWVLHFVHKPKTDRVQQSVLHFRDETTDVIHQRGWLLTLAVLASQGSVLVLVFFCTRSVGITAEEVSGLEVLLAIAVARLVGRHPPHARGAGYDRRRFHRHVDRPRCQFQRGVGCRHDMASDHLFPTNFYRYPDLLHLEAGDGQGNLRQGPGREAGAGDQYCPRHRVNAPGA